MAKAMTLIRRCLMLVILYSLATVSIAQMPSPQMDNLFVLPALEAYPSNDKLAKGISKRSKIPTSVASTIISLAEDNAYETFPTKADILAIIEIESSFSSKSRFRDCFGLMMIQRKSHKFKLKGRDVMNPAVNIEVGAGILHEYFLALDSNVRSAVLASNAGIGNYLKKRYNEKYYRDYRKALAHYSVN
jgi:soluble lytic murein transglycosylase-like protein